MKSRSVQQRHSGQSRDETRQGECRKRALLVCLLCLFLIAAISFEMMDELKGDSTSSDVDQQMLPTAMMHNSSIDWEWAQFTGELAAKSDGANAAVDLSHMTLTLHLSFEFSEETYDVARSGHVTRCLREAARANACFELLLISIDVPIPKDAKHSREVITSPDSIEVVETFRRNLEDAKPLFDGRCRQMGLRTDSQVLIIDYSNKEIMAGMAATFEKAFGRKERDFRRLLPRMFKGVAHQFYIFHIIRTPLLFHQDGNRAFEFMNNSSFFQKGVKLFKGIPRVFYVGLGGCPELDPEKEKWATCCPVPGLKHFANSVFPDSIFNHEAEYPTRYKQHMSMFGFLMNMTRYRRLWPFVQALTELHRFQDINLQRQYNNLESPALAVYMSQQEAGACTVGPKSHGVHWLPAP